MKVLWPLWINLTSNFSSLSLYLRCALLGISGSYVKNSRPVTAWWSEDRLKPTQNRTSGHQGHQRWVRTWIIIRRDTYHMFFHWCGDFFFVSVLSYLAKWQTPNEHIRSLSDSGCIQPDVRSWKGGPGFVLKSSCPVVQLSSCPRTKFLRHQPLPVREQSSSVIGFF